MIPNIKQIFSVLRLLKQTNTTPDTESNAHEIDTPSPRIV